MNWDRTFDFEANNTATSIRQRMLRARLVYLVGYRFRALGLVHKHEDRIRDYFTPLPQHTAGVTTRLSGLRSRCDILIGVHIRHGEYWTFFNGQMFYTCNEYSQYMHRLIALFSGNRVGILVCADARLSANDFFGLPITFGSGVLIEDLYCLSCCDYLLATASTFAIWASFFGRVPLYVINKKYCDTCGTPKEPLSLSNFRVRYP